MEGHPLPWPACLPKRPNLGAALQPAKRTLRFLCDTQGETPRPGKLNRGRSAENQKLPALYLHPMHNAGGKSKGPAADVSSAQQGPSETHTATAGNPTSPVVIHTPYTHNSPAALGGGTGANPQQLGHDRQCRGSVCICSTLVLAHTASPLARPPRVSPDTRNCPHLPFHTPDTAAGSSCTHMRLWQLCSDSHKCWQLRAVQQTSQPTGPVTQQGC